MSPHAVVNPHAELARLRKAQKLADYLSDNWLSEDPDDHEFIALAAMPTSWWQAISQHAKVNPPSATSIDLVISLLRSRMEDPFDLPHPSRDIPTVELPDPDPAKLRESVRKITGPRT